MNKDYINQIKALYEKEQSTLDWESYLAGFQAAVTIFAASRERKADRREIKSSLGFSRVGLKNI